MVEHTKTNRDRFVVVVPKAVEILNKIDRTDKYIFTRDGKRITSIRIASNLNKCGVPLDCIREMLGHSSLATTLEYLFNPLTDNETYDLISKAL